MTRRLIVLAAICAIIGAALLLLLPIHVSLYGSEPVTCGTVFAADTKKAEHTDDINHLGDNGFKAACDSATASRLGWGIGLGAAGVLCLAGMFVVGGSRRRPATTA